MEDDLHKRKHEYANRKAGKWAVESILMKQNGSLEGRMAVWMSNVSGKLSKTGEPVSDPRSIRVSLPRSAGYFEKNRDGLCARLIAGILMPLNCSWYRCSLRSLWQLSLPSSRSNETESYARKCTKRFLEKAAKKKIQREARFWDFYKAIVCIIHQALYIEPAWELLLAQENEDVSLLK